MGRSGRGLWLVLAAAMIIAGGIVAGALIMANRSGDPPPAAAAATSVPQTSAASPTSWPPPLPAGVPTTGENAWRATWTPDPDAEQQLLLDISGMDAGAGTWGPGYIAQNSDRLVGMGYQICADYYRGVSGKDMSDHLLLPGTGLPGPTEFDRLGQAFGIDLAARANLCMNIDPWGESY